jgi:hypothetical protein
MTSSLLDGRQKIVIAAGTYDGVLAGYEVTLSRSDDFSHKGKNGSSSTNKSNRLEIVFASPVHSGSVRSLTLCCNRQQNQPSRSLLLSTGYDEMLKTHDFGKRLVGSGEVRTPADFGTPVCSAFAPPYSSNRNGDNQTISTHCLVGFGRSAGEVATGGKLVIYKKRDWTVQHVLAGHDGGVSTIAVHATGKLALSGGLIDGKLKLWDLEKGRLAYSNPTIKAAATNVQGRKHYDAIVGIVWSESGDCYAFCHGSHITVRDVATGRDLLDVDLPSKANQICLLQGKEGLFVAAACNDGSLPVLAVANVDDDVSTQERRAIMAIEPVDGPVAGEERFKCIQTVTGYYVATANSAGVISLMNLQGAVNMILAPQATTGKRKERPVGSDSDNDDKSDDVSTDDEDDDEELAVEMIDNVQLGTGARITCMVAWVAALEDECVNKDANETKESEAPSEQTEGSSKNGGDIQKKVVMDPSALERARALVSKAKKIQKRKSKKKHKIDAKQK